MQQIEHGFFAARDPLVGERGANLRDVQPLLNEKSITVSLYAGPRSRNTFIHHVQSARSRPRIACKRQ